MNILFLDMDGVMNTLYTSVIANPDDIDAENVKWLKHIVTSVDLKIVLSTSWRHSPELVRKINKRFHDEGFGRIVIDMTPDLLDGVRGIEIMTWLEAQPVGRVKKFAVLDDDTDAGEAGVGDNFFRTFASEGLTEEIANQVIAHFVNG